MSREYAMTAECVSEGHPDKLADQISDSILDAYLSVDPNARVACECLLSGRDVVVAGEITASESPAATIPDIVRSVFREVGYDQDSLGFGIDDVRIHEHIQRQCEEIAHGVDRKDGSLGAGDQGIMFGYANAETPELMPLPVVLARRLMLGLADLRHNGMIPWLMPDGKCQVTIRYFDGKPLRVDTVILSTQHAPGVTNEEISETLANRLITPTLPVLQDDSPPRILINPAGPFTKGGPGADTGLTGRKIVVDAYGLFCPVGGGAFSGKDATKVDRSAAYMARYMAKNAVAAGLASRCTIQLAYAIGHPKPVSITVDTQDTGAIDDGHIAVLLEDQYDLTPAGIIDNLQLRRPIFAETARHGHFGLGAEHQTWECVSRCRDLTSAGGRYAPLGEEYGS